MHYVRFYVEGGHVYCWTRRQDGPIVANVCAFLMFACYFSMPEDG